MVEQIEWVSVDDEMPDDEVSVLVYTEPGDVSVAFMEAGAWQADEEWRLYGVTHWAHLPAGPGQP